MMLTKVHYANWVNVVEDTFLKLRRRFFGTDLTPAFVARDRSEYEHGMTSREFTRLRSFEDRLVENANADSFSVKAFCLCCNDEVEMLVDMQWGGQFSGRKRLPNWRERLMCPTCHMNNRQRLTATLLKQILSSKTHANIYMMEQITPIYKWASEQFQNHQLIGSEYMGHDYKSGYVKDGFRHEDVMKLSFESNSFDLILSNDVFEHIPDPLKGFQECARVLKAGGTMLATIPFDGALALSVTRAKLVNNVIDHLLPPAYHGNPFSLDGSLVFSDFGWDITDEMKTAGFSKVAIEVYVSAEYGHLGAGQLVFRLKK